MSALLHYTSLASYGDRQSPLSFEVDNYLTLPLSLPKCLQANSSHNTTSQLSSRRMTSNLGSNSNSLSYNSNSNSKLAPLSNDHSSNSDDSSTHADSIIANNGVRQEHEADSNAKNTSLDKLDKKLFGDSHSVSSTPNVTSSSASSSSSSPPTFSTKINQSLPVSPLLLGKSVAQTQNDLSTGDQTPVNIQPTQTSSQPQIPNRFFILFLC